MSAAKMKPTPSATVASTDVKERIRKQQQQQEHHQQQQDAKIGNSFAAPTPTDSTPTTSISAAAASVPPAPTKTIPTTSVETTYELQGAVGGRVGGGGGRRNRTKKMRSASGIDFKRSIDKRRAAAKEKRHVNFISTNSKSKLRVAVGGSSKLIKKSASSLKPATVLPTVSKSKSILKVKQMVVLKRQADSGKVSKKLKKAPQGAQSESEAAELFKLTQQFTRTVPPEGGAVDAQQLPKRSVSNEAGRPVSKKNRRLLKRRHSVATKHLPSGAGVVDSSSVNVPPVRRFSPVTNKASFSNARDVKVYGQGNLVNESAKTLDLPTSSRNITIAMAKEQHNKEPKENYAAEQQAQQVPNQASNTNANANSTSVTPVEIADVRSRRGGSITPAAAATATLGGASVAAVAAAADIPGLVDAKIVMPIDDADAAAAAGTITSNNNDSTQEGKVNEESAAKTSTEAAAVAGPSTSSQSAEDDKDKEEDKDAKKKKNRCAECRKKVGLTGFQCRCGGLYCAVHRYSDKHDCTFNYREHGAQEIRRNNPVVVGEKIQKI